MIRYDVSVVSALRQVDLEPKADVSSAFKTIFCIFSQEFVDTSMIPIPSRHLALFCNLNQFCFTPIHTFRAMCWVVWVENTVLSPLAWAFACHSCRGEANDEGRKSHQGDADVSHGDKDFKFSSWIQFQWQSCCDHSLGEPKSALINFADHWCWSNYCKTHPGVGRHEPIKLWRKVSFAILETIIVIQSFYFVSSIHRRHQLLLSEWISCICLGRDEKQKYLRNKFLDLSESLSRKTPLHICNKYE